MRPSTMLSLTHSLSGILLEQANVNLEQMILAEMDGQKFDLGVLIAGINLFKTSLGDIRSNINALRAKMKEECYQDLPTISSSAMEAAGRRMEKNGMITWTAFERALKIYRSGSFYMMLEKFEIQLSNLNELSERLIVKARLCSLACKNGKLEIEMEENRGGNMRPEFAKLYTAWSQFNEFFLASSLVSTEAYYMANGYGSLAQETQTVTTLPV